MLGILSDAHGNHAAFEQAVRILTAHGADEIVFLGDAIGYIPSPKVVRHLRGMSNLRLCVRGNHEDMLLTKSAPSEREPVYQLGLTASLLDDADVAFLSTWEESRRIEYAGATLLFVHGSPQNPIYGYVYPDTPLHDFSPDADVVFMGHTHRPFQRINGDTAYVNVGSCGLPRDDGRYGAAVIFDPVARASTIIRFDISESTRKTLTTASVHDSVSQLFSRTADVIEGRLY